MSSRSSVNVLTYGLARRAETFQSIDAEVVALLVGAHLGELHPLPPEHGAVLARKQRAHEPARAQLDAFDLLEDFGGDGHGG